MGTTVDLNADMGEGFGPWKMGDDESLLDIVTSANIACGMHAGDWDTMAATMAAAARCGVGIGAHPGFPDLQGFGRRRLSMAMESLRNLVAYQVGAALAMAGTVGSELRHLKLHGALANMAAEDLSVARACYSAALKVAPHLTIAAMAGTAQVEAAQDLGCSTACEIFADRAYNDDATLVDRKHPGAVLHDPEDAAERIFGMLDESAIISESGKRIPTQIDTICLHGDTPEAIAMARAIKSRLQSKGIRLRRFVGTVI